MANWISCWSKIHLEISALCLVVEFALVAALSYGPRTLSYGNLTHLLIKLHLESTAMGLHMEFSLFAFTKWIQHAKKHAHVQEISDEYLNKMLIQL